MPPKRRPDKPNKVIPISPHRIRPTLTSPPPMRSKRGRPPKAAPPILKPPQRKRGRPPKGAHPISKTPQRKRPKVDACFYTAKRILDETKTDYLIEWDGIDPKTKKPYVSTWHPKSCANRALVAEWKKEKAGQEWAAQGIVHEDEHYYKIAWEDNPKTGEVYQDTWEPKAFASEAMVKDWEQRKAEIRARGKTSPAGNEAAASDDESIASEDDLNAESEEGHESDEALQQQIAHEIQASPSRSNKNTP